MFDNYKRFDAKMKPKFPKLRIISAIAALPPVLSHKGKIKKINMGGIKPPYLLLGNHNAFMDINVLALATFPHLQHYVIAIDGYLGREGLIRHIGGICKRKFTQDYELIKHIEYCINKKRIVTMFPEARYSLCGTKAIIPFSVARLCKHLNVPVVMLRMHGHHINSPFWNLKDRGVKGIEAELFPLFTKDEIEQATLEEIDEKIQNEFIYDEYEWQKRRHIEIHAPFRAEGLHKVLYKCPHCKTEYRMNSKGTILYCEECHKEWEYTPIGDLKAVDGETEFSHIPDWYEWERDEVRKEVDANKYHWEGEVHVDMLPNPEKYIPMGKAYLIHDMDGFKLEGDFEGEHYVVALEAKKHYGVHIEYEYLGKYGDCVDLNIPDNTFYVYPEGKDFSVTKFSLACEELFKYYSNHR